MKNTYSVLSLIFVTIILGGCQNTPKGSDDCDNGMNKDGTSCVDSTGKASVGPLGYTLYVRGGFNGWGTDNKFEHKGKGIYQARLRAAPGNHEFKLAPVDWKEEWVIANAGKKPATLNTQYPLVRGGSGSFLFVKKTGYYNFTFDFSNPSSPTILITETKGPETKAINPHKRHNIVEEVSFKTWDGKTETVTFSMNYADHKFRRYAQSTTQSLRDPVPQHFRYEEKEGYPRVRSGNLQFDALFALAVEEMRLDSVSDIRDGNYNKGESIPCECFETGAKWHYVWTRDLSYAADLGLALFDPERVVNSLNFKLSGYRDGIEKAPAVPGTDSGLQIVQDTGTGGSWPISTDRMTWSFGAAKALQNMTVVDRQAFSERAYQALKNTIEIDRVAVFDGSDGLYLGEQSFLDWREQTYASWITDDIASLGTSKSLSTNVGHFHALKLASELAQEHSDLVNSVKYQDWAIDLKNAINDRLWLPETGLYSSITASHFDGAPMAKYDWLGLSLAVITGVSEGDRAQQAISNYPHGPLGAPVIYPQQPGIPVYHNRAIWPFVTAYGLKAATVVGNSRVADEAYKTLIRGASLNMSNMENLEWLSAQPMLLDENNPELSGPVINSKRQLWSVGAYLGMVVDSLFGVKTSAKGVSFKPFLTSTLRREQFGKSRSIALYDIKLHGKNFDLKLIMPPASDDQGFYAVKSILFNGEPLKGEVAWQEIKNLNTVVMTLGSLIQDGQKITRVEGNPYSTDDPALFAPLEPSIAGVKIDNDTPVFSISDTKNKGELSYTLYRNGKAISRNVKTKTIAGEKVSLKNLAGCYSVSATFEKTGTVSHHSVPKCLHSGEEISVNDERISTNKPIQKSGAGYVGSFIQDWGNPSDTLNVKSVSIGRAGKYAFQLKYHNAYNEINLGITNGVKWMVLRDENNNEVATGVIQMPHAKVINGKKSWVYSTPLTVQLLAGEYNISVEEFTNMSYLESNTTFTGNGGETGALNRFDIAGLKVTRLSEAK